MYGEEILSGSPAGGSLETGTNGTKTWDSIPVPAVTAPVPTRGKNVPFAFRKPSKGTQTTQRFCSLKHLRDAAEDKNISLKKTLAVTIAIKLLSTRF